MDFLVKSTSYFSQGPRFDFQNLHGGSQLAVTPVPGPSGQRTLHIAVHRHTCRQNTYTLKIKRPCLSAHN